jgi:hypothetical protein
MLATFLKGATAPASSIQYVGGRTFAFAGTTSDVSISLNETLTGGLATTPSAGDLVIVYFGTGSTADRDLVIGRTGGFTPIPYTEVAELFSNDTFDTNLAVAYRRLTGGLSGDTFLVPITGGTLNTADAGVVAIQVWRGVDAVTPLDVTQTTATGGNTVLCDPPAITPTTNGAIIVSGGAGAHSSGTQTFSSSDLTEFLTVGQDDTNDATIGLGYHVWTSGAFDPAQFTFSGKDGTTFSWAAVTLALRPS